jgi:hypothetical protein
MLLLIHIVFLDEQHNVKLGDFGLSRAMEAASEQFAQTFLGVSLAWIITFIIFS